VEHGTQAVQECPMTRTEFSPPQSATDGVHEVAIIGAGFGALALAHHLAEQDVDDVLILERDDGVGGTWRANCYPGAACDVPSHLYSLSFAANPDWTRTYASQPEILAYIERCYDEGGLTSKVRSNTTVRSADWDEERRVWTIHDEEDNEYLARVLVAAVGMFHTPAWPNVPGLDTFEGEVMHSARWRPEHSLAGRRFAVIGTGASAIQVVPAIAPDVEHLDLYQRSPAWIMPRVDEPFSAEERRRFADDPEYARLFREALYERYEARTSFLAGDPSAAEMTAVGLAHLDEAVADSELRSKLTPDYPIGCKRILVSSNFYPALQRDNVELHTEPIAEITPMGIRSSDGSERVYDSIVACTGFHATDYLRGIEVRGREGTEIHDLWGDRPRAYHGLMVPGFPNFFQMYGPNTNQGGNSIIIILEAQARYITQAVDLLERPGARAIEVDPEAMARYEEDLETNLQTTIWTGGCTSYFLSSAGDIVTQLPRTSKWYEDAIAKVHLGDMVFDRD